MFARHAISIDENRASFELVGWANKEQWREGWLKQIWFAGNHSDVGGSYAENESRLSDISLRWMLDEVAALPNPLATDNSLLRLSPSATGMQHDECKGSSAFRFGRMKLRDPTHDAPLHPTVLERFTVRACSIHRRGGDRRRADHRISRHAWWCTPADGTANAARRGHPTLCHANYSFWAWRSHSRHGATRTTNVIIGVTDAASP